MHALRNALMLISMNRIGYNPKYKHAYSYVDTNDLPFVFPSVENNAANIPQNDWIYES